MTLEAQLKTFAPEDASLYAVFVSDRQELEALRASLRDPSCPRPWTTPPASPEVSCEWIPLEPNGRIVVRVDEANQSGKNWVAVVNAEGEFLGAHPLWIGVGDLAELR